LSNEHKIPDNNHAKILIKNEPTQKVYLKIPVWYLENNELEFKSESIILNELIDEYLLIDAYNKGVWIPKNIVQLEKDNEFI
jgi:hypothetical protein